MTADKICPIMSRGEIQSDGDHLLATIYCQRERCMAWVPERYGCANAGETEVCDDIDGETCCSTCPGYSKHVNVPGYCRLLEKGGA